MVRLVAALLIIGILGTPEIAYGQGGRPSGTFRFSHEAGAGLQSLWQASLAAKQERVACLASTIRNDTVIVTRIEALEPEDADSLGISATASVEQCGPPEWSGTVHT